MATKSKTTSDSGNVDETPNGFAGLNGVHAPSLEALQNGIERAVEMNKENVEAFVESMSAATRGLEVISGESLTFVKQVFNESMKAGKALMAVKSPQEFMTMHSDYSRSVFDQIVNQATKVNDLGMTTLKSAYAPINERATSLAKAVQKSRAF
ncbi:MAG: phasin family protein [Alphaproteobacteria bacterium]|nr:phasin family protein [Alphaproteobacteria bacterium]